MILDNAFIVNDLNPFLTKDMVGVWVVVAAFKTLTMGFCIGVGLFIKCGVEVGCSSWALIFLLATDMVRRKNKVTCFPTGNHGHEVLWHNGENCGKGCQRVQ